MLNIIKKTLSNGGYTDISYKNGYMVSLHGLETQVPIGEAYSKKTMQLLRQYRKLAKRYNGSLGLWIEKGTLFIDVSINIINKAEAIKFGIDNKQLAIYDIVNDQTIDL